MVTSVKSRSLSQPPGGVVLLRSQRIGPPPPPRRGKMMNEEETMNGKKMRREELEGTRARAPEAGFKMDRAGAGARVPARLTSSARLSFVKQCIFEQTRQLLAFAPLP